ncbi:627_t:CDS:2 [Diversispora eburnea]|uniref:627_t:CDS:1 n=1 Tax=Diversispora eburnea TaxID=1213867 RepID=A0A9N8WE96_9GLOM|nr:627_t:CDS:2 [Diversispora eburnea]
MTFVFEFKNETSENYNTTNAPGDNKKAYLEQKMKVKEMLSYSTYKLTLSLKDLIKSTKSREAKKFLKKKRKNPPRYLNKFFIFRKDLDARYRKANDSNLSQKSPTCTSWTTPISLSPVTSTSSPVPPSSSISSPPPTSPPSQTLSSFLSPTSPWQLSQNIYSPISNTSENNECNNENSNLNYNNNNNNQELFDPSENNNLEDSSGCCRQNNLTKQWPGLNRSSCCLV